MVSDEVVYALLLFLCIPFGLIIRSTSSSIAREAVSAGTGLVLVLLTCRQHSWHSMLTIAVNICIVRTVSEHKYMHVYSFLWCFSYLAFFRTCHWFGVDRPSPLSNAVQLILTLRLAGVAAEVVETVKLQKLVQSSGKHHTDVLTLKYKGINYSWYHLLSYSFCYIGALTGPFYTCRTYQDMINNKSMKYLPLWSELKHRLKQLSVCAVLFFILSWSVSVQKAKEDSFYEETSVLYRYGYLYLLFAWFKMRFYSAWLLAESMAITAGLGAYPSTSVSKCGAGPTNLQVLESLEEEEPSEISYDFEAIHNIQPAEIETSSTIQDTIKHWNKTVQWWLVVHVYKNTPIRNKLVRSIILMVISAFWHGVHPGWYATFLSAPFLRLAEDAMERGVRRRLTTDTQRWYYDTVACFVTMRYFEYFAVGSFFLFYDEIWRFWSSLYFYGHISLLALIIIGQIFSRVFRPHTGKLHHS